MNDNKLISGLLRSDTRALDGIIRKYTPYVCTVARNFSRGAIPACDIDEISVEVFYNLWKYRENLTINVGLPAYLSAAARNAVKRRFREFPPLCEDIDGLELPSGLYVEDIAELNETTACLNEGLRQLPKEDREIFLRFYLYGETSSDISEATGITESTVRTKLRRVRIKLKNYLTERGLIMFEDFLKDCPIKDIEKVSRKRMNSNIAAVRTMICQEDAMENNKIHISRGKKRLTAAVAAIAAAATLTVTAGALTDWSFFSYLRQQYGDNAEKMTEYFVSNTSYEVLTETFEDYDFEVKGIAADEHVVLAALEVTALGGKKLPAFNGMSIIPDTFPVSFGAGSGFRWESVNEEKTHGIAIFDMDITEPLKTGAYLSLTNAMIWNDGWNNVYGELTVHFDMPEIRTKDIDIKRDIEMPLTDTSTDAENQEEISESWNISRANISGISVTLYCRYPDSDYTLLPDSKKCFIRLDDGQEISMTMGGSGGSSVVGSGIVDGQVTFTFDKPVDVDRIVSLNFGEYEIPVV